MDNRVVSGVISKAKYIGEKGNTRFRESFFFIPIILILLELS